jgi:hypothetical protein
MNAEGHAPFVTPGYDSTFTIAIRYPGPSPEEANAVHKEFVS